MVVWEGTMSDQELNQAEALRAFHRATRNRRKYGTRDAQFASVLILAATVIFWLAMFYIVTAEQPSFRLF